MAELDVRPEVKAAVTVAAWLTFSWERFIVGVCVVFHSSVAVALAALGHTWWAALFALPAVAALLLFRRVSTRTLLGATYTVGPVALAALPALVTGVLGEDWYMPGVIAWITLYLIFAVAVVRLALEKR